MHKMLLIFSVNQELELYKEELLGKPAILVINKMDLPEAQSLLRELEAHLESQEGRFYLKRTGNLKAIYYVVI